MLWRPWLCFFMRVPQHLGHSSGGVAVRGRPLLTRRGGAGTAGTGPSAMAGGCGGATGTGATGTGATGTGAATIEAVGGSESDSESDDEESEDPEPDPSGEDEAAGGSVEDPARACGSLLRLFRLRRFVLSRHA
jgi:hypothetical protein